MLTWRVQVLIHNDNLAIFTELVVILSWFKSYVCRYGV